jgi:hypothetical protein
MTFLLFFGLVVFHLDYGPADDPRGEQHKRTVRVDGKGFREFLEILA